MNTATRPYASSRGDDTKRDARVDHSLVSAIEVVDAKEQADAPGELLADDGVLMLAVCLREQDAGLASGGPNDDPALRPPVVGQRRRVLHELELQHVDEEANRGVVVADDQRDKREMRHRVSGYSGPMTLVAPDGRVSLPNPDIPCERPT